LAGNAKRTAGPPVVRSAGGVPLHQVPQQKLTTNDALSYLREVKTRFADKRDVYDTFLEIMKEFKAQRIDTSGVIVRVKKLFKGHRELILGFNTFLPRGYEIELQRISDDEEEEPAPPPPPPPVPSGPRQPVEFDQAINYVNKIKTRFAGEERVYKAFLEILNLYRKGQKTITNVYEEVAVLFRNHQDLLDEFTYFLPDNTASAPPMPRAPARGPPQNIARGAGGRAPARASQMGPPGSPTDHSRFMHKRKAARKAEEGFRRMDEDDTYGAGIRGRPLAKELNFLEKVKGRLRSRESYGDFLKVLNMYSQEIIGRAEMHHLVSELFGRAPDLIQSFNTFVAGCEMVELSELSGAGGRTTMSNRDMLKAKLQKDKFMTKPLSEIVASETERITPSYVPMPPGYPKLHSAGRTPVGEEVLNDQYVNVITGSEDYSFKLMRKNQYEEALFRCEDDRYEFEICCEHNLSALRVLRPLQERLAVMSPDDKANFRLDDVPGLNAVHFGHIQRLYADQGQVMVELLKKNPAVAVPVVLLRLEQKDAEWRKVKEEMTKIWKKIYEQNYPRSLDHRSFYFKQQEKKNLMAKAMVSEIKEAADKRKADEANLRCLSMAHRYCVPAAPAPHADLTYEYADRKVFEDCHLVLRTAIESQLHSGVREQVLMLYLQCVEHFFGLPVRADELDRLKAEAEDSAAGGDADMADTKSESSDPEGGEGGQRRRRKTPTPMPEGTPEDGGRAEPSGAETGATDAEDEDASADQRVKRGGSGAGGMPDDGLEARGGPCDSCKPVMPWCGAGAGAAASNSSEANNTGHYTPPAGTRLLFGNENIYVFFRFHRFLFDRLASARKFSVEIATKKATAPSYRGGLVGVQEATPAPDAATEAQIKEESERLHSSFLASAKQLLGNTGMDIGAFEDQVRALLGTNSYELFTLDKLCSKLVKHMQLMVQDEATFKLWEMYRYEQSRGKPLAATVYHVNCLTVLDDTCYRMEFTDGDASMRVQMNDAEKADGFIAPEGALTDYIQGYLDSPPALPPAPSDQEPPSAIYLKRTLPGARTPPGTFNDERLADAVTKVLVTNGLECKISCASCKVSYVLDTEDVMVRRVRRSPALEAVRAARAGKMAKWLSAKSDKATQEAKEEEEAAAVIAGVQQAASMQQ